VIKFPILKGGWIGKYWPNIFAGTFFHAKKVETILPDQNVTRFRQNISAGAKRVAFSSKQFCRRFFACD